MKKNFKYKIVIVFETDQKLTDAEFGHLADACLVQVEDPADHTGKNKRARFSTLNYVVSQEVIKVANWIKTR